jgi:anhydro-N-acetylmuramic acid kinase
MEKLIRILNKKERVIIGVMSGTSLDGIDVALVRFAGKGTGIAINPLEFRSYPMPAGWRKRIRQSFSADTAEICRINYDLGRLFADTVSDFCRDLQFPLEQLDAVGLHGQTLYHIHNHSTLQSGEPEIMARELNCIVVSDFRSADIAAGGSGAPLVPYLDQILFRNDSHTIALQNLGGIGNITYLPKKASDAVLAFDTGPSNAILNETVEIITAGELSFDKDGSVSGQGRVNAGLLAELLQHGYFNKPLPKSTGREEFGKAYVKTVLEKHPELEIHDLLRTFVSLIAHSIYRSCRHYLAPIDKLYVSGGGAHHPLIMDELSNLFGSDKVFRLDQTAGISVDSKEAVAFALLAHERLNNVPTNIPSVTGASYRTTLGKLTVPY